MDPSIILSRGLFDKLKGDDNSSVVTCPVPKTSGPEIVPFVGNLTFHSFATILSGSCGLLCFVVIFSIIGLHAINYTNPIQQRQIIRILLLIPWIALLSFLTIWQEGAGEYIEGGLDFGSSIALAAFLLLMCDYILASPHGFEALLGPGASVSGKRAGADEVSPTWFKRVWYMVLQLIPSSLMIWVATCITLAINRYCAASNSPHFAHIWITVITAIIVGAAVFADLKVYSKNKEALKQHNALLKFAAFKGIIGLKFLQSFIINILIGHGTITTSKYLTYHDIKIGLPTLILSVEMPLFAILVAIAFPVSPYKFGQGVAAGPITAIVEALNITDLLSCFVRGPMRLVREQQWGIQRQSSMPLASTPAFDEAGPYRGRGV